MVHLARSLDCVPHSNLGPGTFKPCPVQGLILLGVLYGHSTNIQQIPKNLLYVDSIYFCTRILEFNLDTIKYRQ